jgi:preprotein translocase subunit SecD
MLPIMKYSFTKMAVVIAIALLGVYYTLGNFYDLTLLPKKNINLGLDLKGGSSLLLEIEDIEYFSASYESNKDDLRAALDEEKLPYTMITSDNNGMYIVANEPDLAAVINRLSNKFKDYDFVLEAGRVAVKYSQVATFDIYKRLREKSVEIIRRRVDETGTTEPSIAVQGQKRILVQVPGYSDPEGLKRLLGKTAKLEFRRMSDTDPYYQNMGLPLGDEEILADADGRKYIVKKVAAISGEMLVDAHTTYNESNQVAVGFSLNNEGAKTFSEITKNNIGKPFAILLDNVVLTAPTIQSHIPSGSGIITGNYTEESANEMSLLLRSGALPVPLKSVEQRVVGASLGSDSIHSGVRAMYLAIALVVIMMVVFYGIAGLLAAISLLFYIACVLGLFSMLGATLSLPGIAGLILTIGMAVDANVLIFERMIEEKKAGRSIWGYVENGYSGAWTSIVDSNITTILAAVILFFFGSGPVKGFGVALSIGIICSMFSAISLTRLFIFWYIKVFKPTGFFR